MYDCIIRTSRKVGTVGTEKNPRLAGAGGEKDCRLGKVSCVLTLVMAPLPFPVVKLTDQSELLRWSWRYVQGRVGDTPPSHCCPGQGGAQEGVQVLFKQSDQARRTLQG